MSVQKPSSTGGDVSNNWRGTGRTLPNVANSLFLMVADGEDRIPVDKFLTALKATGLQTDDPRLKECMESLRQIQNDCGSDVLLDQELFERSVQSNIDLLAKAFSGQLVIKDFQSFASHIHKMHEDGKSLLGGKVASYIPELAKFSPDLWAVAVCTVDGQRYNVGDFEVPFTLQSCVKPELYAMAIKENGTENVHANIGKEPSGGKFNKLFLNENYKPHNPMVNAGAIVCASLIKQGASNEGRLDYVMTFLKTMTGNEYVGFSNATFRSELATGHRNFAISYYLKEKECFPKGSDLQLTLEFYFQLCSIEVNCKSASVMAATLANGGVCPITGECVLSPEVVRNTLSVMASCGMYNSSGWFAFEVGLPAKSGVSGGILLVVPNVMGIMCWSPPVDNSGNSVRGMKFCTDFVKDFKYHIYERSRPVKGSEDESVKSVSSLLYAAYRGDVSSLRRLALLSVDMEQSDYDSRTALHLAAAEGHTEVVRFLLEACKVNPVPTDRWGKTPMDEARKFGHQDVIAILQQRQQSTG